MEASVHQILNAWTNLNLRRQIVVGAATFAMFIAILAMSRMVTAPNMTLLYAGLESSSAGDVVRALEQRGIAYQIRGKSIFVDSKQRDKLRLTLASEGLPTNTNHGYELLDNLSGFGTTSQMFDAAYWRAKEGELARTIVSNPYVAMARVHIANTDSNPFQRGVTPKASVMVTPNGGAITSAQAKAVRFLVASAVAGLSPDDVTVIDANGGMIGPTDDATALIGDDDKAQVLRERVQRLLEARVGPGNAIVEVSVETVTETEAIRERVFDPESRVAISTDTEERSTASSNASGGEVTVASNLPETENGDADQSSSKNSESRERVNYEVSQTEREIVRAPGAIKRLSVAVLVNQLATTATDGTETLAPRDETEMQALQELISSAVGFDEARGDIITIKSMPLQMVMPSGTLATTSLLDHFDIHLMSVLQMAVLAIVTLTLGLFVIRPVLSKETNVVAAPAAIGPPQATQTSGAEALTGEIEDGDPAFSGAIENLPLASNQGNEAAPADPVDRLRSMIGERQEETVQVLRSWLEEKEEKA